MRAYTHEKKNELETALFRSGKAGREPENFSVVLDENGELIKDPAISRRNELIGAGIQYTMSIVDYYCTHYKNDLVPTIGKAKRVQLPTLTWGMAIDIATGGIYGQRRRAEEAILNLRAAQKPVIMYGMDGTIYSMIPFVIDLTYEDGKKATTASAAKLARLIKNTPAQEFRTIKYIDIQFALPMYEGFFQRAGNYSFPTGMYAKFYESDRFLKKNGTMEKETDLYIDFYCNIARYFALHNNLGNKKEDSKSHIFKSLEEIFIDVYPTAIQWRDGKAFLQNKHKAWDLLATALLNYRAIAGFPFYPVIEGFAEDESGRIRFGLYKNRSEAIQTASALQV